MLQLIKMFFGLIIIFLSQLINAWPHPRQSLPEFELTIDTLYYIHGLEFGSPPQKIKSQVLLDTGSSDTLVSTFAFNPQKSKTFKNSSLVFNGVYGSISEFALYKAFDVITAPNGVKTNQTLAITNVNPNLLNDHNVIVGMGYDTTQFIRPNYPNFISSFKDQNKIKRTLFSINGQVDGGSVLFGGVYTDIYEDVLTKVELIPRYKNRKWFQPYLTVSGIKLSDGSVISNQTCACIIDTGADLLPFSKPMLGNLFAALNDASGDYFYVNTTNPDDPNETPFYYFPLDSIKDLSIKLDVQGYELDLPVIDVIHGIKIINGKAYGGIAYQEAVIDVQVDAIFLPAKLLTHYYSVWDYDNHFIYFAKYKNRGKIGCNGRIAVDSGDQLPVATTNVPHASTTYSVGYQTSLETTVSGADSIINSPKTYAGSNNQSYTTA
ncbi:SAP30 [Candida jiufengensis]|uniref:SAP30 n=1 Tax=Candida jiufengensis TaxID=497108 RepID=UPI002224F18E|nr:SAP30 [Candida jiufengensis]KAI5951760.1 SAP30 [Candida jiufengensis]